MNDNDTLLMIFIGLVLFFTVTPYSVQRIMSMRRDSQETPPEIPETVQEAINVGIRSLVQQNKLKEAIQAYRDHNQVDQLTAKEAIIAIQQSQRKASESSITRNAAGGIIRLVKEGKIDIAIKVYQEATGADLATAQRAIAQIQRADLNVL